VPSKKNEMQVKSKMTMSNHPRCSRLK